RRKIALAIAARARRGAGRRARAQRPCLPTDRVLKSGGRERRKKPPPSKSLENFTRYCAKATAPPFLTRPTRPQGQFHRPRNFSHAAKNYGRGKKACRKEGGAIPGCCGLQRTAPPCPRCGGRRAGNQSAHSAAVTRRPLTRASSARRSRHTACCQR